jgi:hypothetical protein
MVFGKKWADENEGKPFISTDPTLLFEFVKKQSADKVSPSLKIKSDQYLNQPTAKYADPYTGNFEKNPNLKNDKKSLSDIFSSITSTK